MPDIVYLTKESFEEIKKDLMALRTKGRREIAQKIAEARSHGDLSENAEYDAAKNEQELLEIKIHKLESTMAKTQIISPDDMPNDKIYILTKVKIKNRINGSILDYQLVSPEEADFEKKKISVTSPIGKALMGKVPGDIAVMNAPAGKVEYEILEISK